MANEKEKTLEEIRQEFDEAQKKQARPLIPRPGANNDIKTFLETDKAPNWDGIKTILNI